MYTGTKIQPNSRRMNIACKRIKINMRGGEISETAYTDIIYSQR